MADSETIFPNIQIVEITNIEDGTKFLEYPFYIDEETQTVRYIEPSELSLEQIVEVLEEKDIDDMDDNGLNQVSPSHTILAVLLTHLVGKQRTHDIMWKLSKVGGLNQLAVDFRVDKNFTFDELLLAFADTNEDFSIFQAKDEA